MQSYLRELSGPGGKVSIDLLISLIEETGELLRGKFEKFSAAYAEEEIMEHLMTDNPFLDGELSRWGQMLLSHTFMYPVTTLLWEFEDGKLSKFNIPATVGDKFAKLCGHCDKHLANPADFPLNLK